MKTLVFNEQQLQKMKTIPVSLRRWTKAVAARPSAASLRNQGRCVVQRG